MDARVPFPAGLYALIRVDVVGIEVSLLLGLDCVDALGVYINKIEDRLKCDKRGISTPLARNNQHIYPEWGEDVHCTTTELERLHLHVAHTKPGRLAVLLRRACDPKASPGTRARLDEVSEGCDVCQRLSRAPGLFRVALPPEDISFNRIVLLDLM